MRKLTTKFLILVFLGLFGTTVSFSYAQAEGDKKENGIMGIKYQDAWKFMKDNAAAYGNFKEVYGENAKSRPQNVVACGEKMCNLDKNVCLRKSSYSWKAFGKDVWNNLVAAGETAIGGGGMVAGGTMALTGAGTVAGGGVAALGASTMYDGAGRFQYTTAYKYMCVSKGKEGEYTKDGWTNVGSNEENMETISHKASGENAQEKHETKDCYQARVKTGSKAQLKQYCIKPIGDTIEVQAADSEGDGCTVVPVRWYNNSKCTFCSMLGGVYWVANDIAQKSLAKFAGSFAILIALGMLIWIAMKTLVFVSSMTKQDAAKYITEMMKQSYKFMIAFFLLLYYNETFQYIILPLLDAGLSFGLEFVSVIGIEERFKDDSGGTVKSLLDLKNWTDLETLYPDYYRNKENGLYLFETYARLENLAYNVNLNYALLQTIGSGLVCLGWNYMTGNLGNNAWEIGLGFACVTYGVAFSVFGFFLCLAFVFYLFDAVVQLGIVGGLLPFLIACWPFKITSKYTSTGFKMLLNSIFTFMMMGVVVKISLTLISKAVGLNAERPADDAGGNGDNMELSGLVEAMDNIDTEKLRLMVNILSIGFCLFMFANIMGFLLLARVSELVNRFAGGGMKAAAPSIATMGASTVKGMATKLAAPTMNAVGEWTSDKVERGTQWAAKKAVGIATLRPLRKWGYNKIKGKLTSGRSDPQVERKKEVDAAKQQIGGDGKTKVSLGGSKAPVAQQKITIGGKPKTEASAPIKPKTEEKSSPKPAESPAPAPVKPEGASSGTQGRRPDTDNMD